MNTDVKETKNDVLKRVSSKSELQTLNFTLPTIYKAMEEYAKAYAPVPSDEDYEGAGNILYPLELQEIILNYKAWLESMIPHVKKSIKIQISEKIKSLGKYQFAAPVPGKENICPVCGGNHSAISPSTASNEDKFVWTDELVKNYAEWYIFSSSRLSIESFKAGNFNFNQDCVLGELNPKAVQQAAKELYPDATEKDLPIDVLQFSNSIQEERRKAFLAGASFNKDAVEESDQDQYWSQAISMIEVAQVPADGTMSEKYLEAYKKLHESLKSKYTISRNKNETQQAHDKSTYE